MWRYCLSVDTTHRLGRREMRMTSRQVLIYSNMLVKKKKP
jgi:hypothetical protein